MTDQDIFRQMLAALAGLYAAEGNEGGDEVAAGISQILAGPLSIEPAPQHAISAHAAQALATSRHPLAGMIAAAMPLIKWDYAGLEDGKIRPEIAANMLTAELIGPDGMIFHPGFRMGLFLQGPNVHYVTREHPAEETFIMLGGTGFWSTHNGPGIAQTAGAVINHPSMTPHSSETLDEPLLAAWRWNGEIGWEGYCMTG